MTIGLIALAALAVLLLVRVPVGIAMIIVGFFGTLVFTNPTAAFATMTGETIELAMKLEIMVIPFFLLMGNLAGVCGLSRDLFDVANALLGRMRGGLASATVIGCGGFAALSGSSVAAAVTMGKVAIPQMNRFGYDDRLATGVVAAGGTLGILIPPSAGFAVYGILTEQSIGKLFLAGVLPGILLMTLFILVIMIVTAIWPHLGPAAAVMPRRERMQAVFRSLPFILVVLTTIGGIYLGVFTPMESAGVGAIATFFVALWRRSLSWSRIRLVLVETTTTTAMIYIILIGASIFTPFLARTGIPSALSAAMLDLELGVFGSMMLLMVAYLILGTFLDGFALLALTLPIVFPVIVSLGLDPIWFGVFMVVVLEMALISPPVGMNVFVLKSIVPDISLSHIYTGTLPFLLAMIVLIVLLVLWPDIALFLPETMGR
ncbi:TRAP transporter large permease [Nitratireductor kimnyeongensis]|uniref:TRAP transporter large permease protein n=1 Tax=Nitratireductor kimnyeongensis TaxID=430679 RepID=A0ABW0T9Q8_9HYPH|nr:TRAP transporter large permease [Nitratireductor kimnyeongensis]QZZ36166.1 TRAP transporter large permease [Nitratireductor kimnyeongensis]